MTKIWKLLPSFVIGREFKMECWLTKQDQEKSKREPMINTTYCSDYVAPEDRE